uniref:Reverse transcriptase domain-containing protein n=1 Tax=Salvator merianae TaxID=96440 RepID=A0A8D0B6V3_SALMN
MGFNKFLATKVKTLTVEQQDVLSGFITRQEIISPIKKASSHKLPGEDGFTALHYKAFQELLVPHMEKLYNFILKTGNIPPSWNNSILLPIIKPGKPQENSYRPISLLNQDYKIFSSILVNHIKKNHSTNYQ